jgi:hypothetical protein
MHVAFSRGRRVLGVLLLGASLGVATAHRASAQAGFLPFAEELRRARLAVGQNAECRVLVEELSARCDLDVGGSLSISHETATIPQIVSKSVVLSRSRMPPTVVTAILTVYGIPADLVARCAALRPGAAADIYEYVGDFAFTCNPVAVNITYARRF